MFLSSPHAVCLFACLPVCLSACRPVCLSASTTGPPPPPRHGIVPPPRHGIVPPPRHGIVPPPRHGIVPPPRCLQITTDDLLQAALLEEGGYPSPHEGGPMRQRQLALNEATLAAVAFNFPDFRNLQVVRTRTCKWYALTLSSGMHSHLQVVCTHTFKWYAFAPVGDMT